jgi:AMME syndrome candidate gene 1 protein
VFLCFVIISPHEKNVVLEASSSDVENASEPPASKEPAATPAMCYHCFDVLIQTLETGSSHNNKNRKRSGDATTAVPEFVNELHDASVECPIFVTWEKRKHGSGACDESHSSWQLRGCIGTLGPRLLATAVGEYAEISALRDHRFSPIGIAEVSSLRVSVSLLVEYEECTDVFDWAIGVHGILIKFVVNGHHYNATYLPEVAKQQQWDHSKTVSSLVHKAGYNGNVTSDLLKSVHCTRYQSSKYQVTFDEYVRHSCNGHSPIFNKSRHLSWNPCNSM